MEKSGTGFCPAATLRRKKLSIADWGASSALNPSPPGCDAHSHRGRYQRPAGDWERLEMMNKVKPLRNDRRLSQVEQHRSFLSPLKPNLSQIKAKRKPIKIKG